MSIFVADDFIEVSIKYAQIGKNDLTVIVSEEEEEFFKDAKMKFCKAKFARPGWENFNNYLEGTVKESAAEMVTLDTILLRKNKFKILLREIEDDGIPIPVSMELFQKIIPELAIALIEEYDRQLNLEREAAYKKEGILSEDPKEETTEETTEETKEEEDSKEDETLDEKKV